MRIRLEMIAHLETDESLAAGRAFLPVAFAVHLDAAQWDRLVASLSSASHSPPDLREKIGEMDQVIIARTRKKAARDRT